jgi:hypothetical protein
MMRTVAISEKKASSLNRFFLGDNIRLEMLLGDATMEEEESKRQEACRRFESAWIIRILASSLKGFG